MPNHTGSKVRVYARIALDHPSLNVMELSATSSIYGGTSASNIAGEYYSFIIGTEHVNSVIARLCGSRLAGIMVGFCQRSSLNLTYETINKIVGSDSYRVRCRPRDSQIVPEMTKAIAGRADLNRFKHEINIVKLDERYLVGVSNINTCRRTLSALPPKKWPYFHAGVLPAYFSGIMCNLSACPPNGVLLDPFCGSGSTILAGAALGLNCVGIDISKKQIYGCRRNVATLCPLLANFSGEVASLLRADATFQVLSTHLVDAAVFDPPYGRVTSLFGKKLEELVDVALRVLNDELKKHAKICFMCPSTLPVKELLHRNGFDLTYFYPIRANRTLTRAIVVAKK